MTAPRKTVENARRLRRVMTLPEVKLWAWLRSRPAGIRFRRQHPIGPFTLDFYCPAAKLVIEVDGMAHDTDDNPRRDEIRDDWLAKRGLRTRRIRAVDVLNDLDAVARMIISDCGG